MLPTLYSSLGGPQIVVAHARDSQGRSHVIRADAVVSEIGALRLLSAWEVLASPGPPGHFDEAGIVVSDLEATPSGVFALTHGWRLRRPNGWFNGIGSMDITPDLRSVAARRVSAPIVMSDLDPISTAYPHRDRLSGDLLYCSTTSISADSGYPIGYRIHRRNRDRTSSVFLDPLWRSKAGLYAYARPQTLVWEDDRHLWLCSKGDKYRIEHWRFRENSRSPAGLVRGGLGLTPSGDGGEVSEVSYPHVSVVERNLLMLYNGDGYGRTGFGVAIAPVSELAS